MSGNCEECGKERPHGSEWPYTPKKAGWFLLKDGTSYCPEHIPDWVPAWREQKKAEKAQEKVLLIAGYLSTHPGALAYEPSNPADYIPIAERVMEIVRGEL